MRNHEHYIDPTAYAAIKRADRTRKRKPKSWGDRLTYTVGEIICCDTNMILKLFKS
ncbi:MAG: hypothetical protein ACK5JH_11285 [Anaerocolumna sp.]